MHWNVFQILFTFRIYYYMRKRKANYILRVRDI